jgi:hypothetical protein
MLYLKALLVAFVAAVGFGIVSGVLQAVKLLPPEHRATVYAQAIATATSYIALYTFILIPVAILGAWMIRKSERRR